MKNKFLLSLFIFLCLPFYLTSCGKREPINLQIHDIFDGFTTLNPILTWDDKPDSEYEVVLTNNLTNETIEIRDNVASPFSLGGYLDSNTQYTVSIKQDNKSNGEDIDFTTAADGGDRMDSVDSYTLVYGAFSNNMVIQRDQPFKIKGYTKKGVQVSVVLNDEVYTSVSNGEWELEIPAHSGSIKPFTLQIITSNKRKIEYKNLVFGDVFLVSGQSNIQWPIKDSDYLEDDLNIDSNMVRFFAQSTVNTQKPSKIFLDGRWFLYDRNNEGNQQYSAICLMLGSMLSKELKDTNIPIGIMYAAQGDTNISKWIENSYYEGTDSDCGIFYNGMIAPFSGLNIKGVVWYQGCNDSGKAIQYQNNLKTLFSCYRDLFNEKELPFFVVQLPCFDGDEGNKFNFAYIRDAQYKACLEDENAYLIATCDGGDPTYIHPREKRYICERLTKSILATIFNYQNMKEGPQITKIEKQNNELIISLKNNEGLHSKTCKGFILSGKNGRFFDAKAEISNGKLVVSSEKVNDPIYVRYGFFRSPFLDIYNADGYLLSPFRNDDNDKNIDLLNYSDLSVYKKDPSSANCNISFDEGKLIFSKEASEIGYSAINIDRWAPVCNTAKKFRFVFEGTGSGAKIQVRFIESSYEIWAFTFVDNSSSEKEMEVDVEDIECIYNPVNEMFDFESIMQIGLLIESNSDVCISISEAKFV